MKLERVYRLCNACYRYNTPSYFAADSMAANIANIRTTNALEEELKTTTPSMVPLIELAIKTCKTCDKSEAKIVELLEKNN
jgi:hypothetical protein